MPSKNISTIILTVATTLAALFLSGCVERKLTINTVPTGALVELNDEEIGQSPVTVSFKWYGDYNIRVSKKGYEILQTHRKLEQTFHDKFPFDFIYGVLSPKKIVDEHEWTFHLKKYTPPDRDELIKQSIRVKQQMESEAATQPVTMPK